MRAHDARDLVWNEAYDAYAHFPEGSESYGRIELLFTLGCASSGCSDWDYTVLLSLVDTVSGMEYDLGRCITPYGGYMRTGQKGFNNDWKRTFRYDVSDFSGLLRSRQKLRIYYDGWSSGFSGTLDFAFIEGTPTREVLGVEVLYYSGASEWSYNNSTDFESTRLPAKTVTLPTGTEHVRFRITPSGHGFDNNVFCAEFCERDYSLQIDGSERFRQSMWREDCGFNPVYPQAGTWLYDRANWCPGSEAWTYFHEVALDTSPLTWSVDLNVDAYTWTGTQTPSYILSAVMVRYGAFQHAVDAEIADVLEPNSDYAHARFNPSCGQPRIVLRNNGGDPLTSCTFSYGVEGGTMCYQDWTGNLAFGESEEVVLGNINWTGVDLSNPHFRVRVEQPNNTEDEVLWNNERRVSFDIVPLYDNRFVVWMRTNAQPTQNSWRIENDLGATVASRSTFDGPFTVHEDTVDLPNGCYRFILEDTEKDGLEFFANSDGTGIIRFARVSSGFLASFDANFGTRLVHSFTTGLPLGNVNSSESCDVTGLPGYPVPDGSQAELLVWPNPVSESGSVQWQVEWLSKGLHGKLSHPLTVQLHNLNGEAIWTQHPVSLNGYWTGQIALQGITPGLYVLSASTDTVRLSRLLQVN